MMRELAEKIKAESSHLHICEECRELYDDDEFIPVVYIRAIYNGGEYRIHEENGEVVKIEHLVDPYSKGMVKKWIKWIEENEGVKIATNPSIIGRSKYRKDTFIVRSGK